LDFAPHGQLIEWDDDESKFFYTNQDFLGFLSEERLRKIFRQCIVGLHYCKNSFKKLPIKFLPNKKKKLLNVPFLINIYFF